MPSTQLPPSSEPFDPYAPPKAKVLETENGLNFEGVVFVKKGVVLIKPNGHLPALCIDCGLPAHHFNGRRFSWYPPWHLLVWVISFIGLAFLIPYLPEGSSQLLILHPAVCVILSIIFRKKSEVTIGLCNRHKRQNQRYQQFKFVLAMVFVASFVLIFIQIIPPSLPVLLMALCGLGLVILNRLQINLRVIGISSSGTRLKGFGKGFIQQLQKHNLLQ